MFSALDSVVYLRDVTEEKSALCLENSQISNPHHTFLGLEEHGIGLSAYFSRLTQAYQAQRNPDKNINITVSVSKLHWCLLMLMITVIVITIVIIVV